jgi:hypothetical protein
MLLLLSFLLRFLIFNIGINSVQQVHPQKKPSQFPRFPAVTLAARGAARRPPSAAERWRRPGGRQHGFHDYY